MISISQRKKWTVTKRISAIFLSPLVLSAYMINVGYSESEAIVSGSFLLVTIITIIFIYKNRIYKYRSESWARDFFSYISDKELSSDHQVVGVGKYLGKSENFLISADETGVKIKPHGYTDFCPILIEWNSVSLVRVAPLNFGGEIFDQQSLEIVLEEGAARVTLPWSSALNPLIPRHVPKGFS